MADRDGRIKHRRALHRRQHRSRVRTEQQLVRKIELDTRGVGHSDRPARPGGAGEQDLKPSNVERVVGQHHVHKVGDIELA